MRVLLPAGDIPLGSTVTKRSGETEYVLRDALRIYGPDKQVQTISAQGGACFLVSPSGDATAISATTLLLWSVEDEEYLLSWLEKRVYGEEQ